MREIQLVTPNNRPILVRKRVCAYARVSTAKDAMLHSLSSQVSYYQKYIQAHKDWEFCGVYADEGLTGTKESRAQFQEMLKECRYGNIDIILTKSISRFARNTVDLLNTVRELKSLGIAVYFEEQNINTLSSDGELMLTILASYAQEESLSASENMKWSIRKGFEHGELCCFRFMYGYRIERGSVTVCEEEAAIVQEVFDRFAKGESMLAIAKNLNARGISTHSKRQMRWSGKRIGKMLTNEKYTGNALLQKTYINNHLEKKRMVNRGELPKYYAEQTHPAIIDAQTYRLVQERIERNRGRHTVKIGYLKSAFTGKMFCGYCGEPVWRGKNNGRTIWGCRNARGKGVLTCHAASIRNDILEETCCSLFGLSTFDPTFIEQNVRKIILYDNRLVFSMADGREEKISWKNKSRSQSWTPEMKERARQRTMERLQNRRINDADSKGNTSDS